MVMDTETYTHTRTHTQTHTCTRTHTHSPTSSFDFPETWKITDSIVMVPAPTASRSTSQIRWKSFLRTFRAKSFTSLFSAGVSLRRFSFSYHFVSTRGKSLGVESRSEHTSTTQDGAVLQCVAVKCSVYNVLQSVPMWYNPTMRRGEHRLLGEDTLVPPTTGLSDKL